MCLNSLGTLVLLESDLKEVSSPETYTEFVDTHSHTHARTHNTNRDICTVIQFFPTCLVLQTLPFEKIRPKQIVVAVVVVGIPSASVVVGIAVWIASLGSTVI